MEHAAGRVSLLNRCHNCYKTVKQKSNKGFIVNSCYKDFRFEAYSGECRLFCSSKCLVAFYQATHAKAHAYNKFRADFFGKHKSCRMFSGRGSFSRTLNKRKKVRDIRGGDGGRL